MYSDVIKKKIQPTAWWGSTSEFVRWCRCSCLEHHSRPAHPQWCTDAFSGLGGSTKGLLQWHYCCWQQHASIWTDLHRTTKKAFWCILMAPITDRDSSESYFMFQQLIYVLTPSISVSNHPKHAVIHDLTNILSNCSITSIITSLFLNDCN